VESNLEKKQRLQAMTTDDLGKWDLSDNDIEAIKYGLACIDAYAELIIQSVPDRASEVGVQPEVIPKIAEAFERYLRSESEYPSINWSEKTVEEYRNDRRYRKDIYEEMKWQSHFSYAFEFAKKRLFDKIIKETLDSNFTA